MQPEGGFWHSDDHKLKGREDQEREGKGDNLCADKKDASSKFVSAPRKLHISRVE